MAFTKRTYKDQETVITAANLNAIQDELIRVASGLENGNFQGEPGKDGVGIASIQQTTTSNADGGSNVFTVTLTNGVTARFTVKNGSKGSTGATGSPGTNGNNGSDGVGISSIKQTTTSTADGGNNVITVTLSNGETATFTVRNGSKGSAGEDGADGVTPALSIGTVTTLSAGSSATATITGTAEKPVLNLGIPKGKDGTSGGGTGGTGADGEDGGYYVPALNAAGDLSWSATKSDMPSVQTVNIKGDKGDTGATGAAGYSPVRGTDYWTASDIAEIKSYVDEAILGGAW